MPNWKHVLFIGVCLFTLSGEAHAQASDAQEATAEKQPATQYLPLPVPIEIIQDQAAADAAKRREQQADQREIEGLSAQQSMDRTAQAANAATQDMRDYALYSTGLVAAGTLLLFITLTLTWQANRAAVAAVEVTRDIGQRQVRAYVGVSEAIAEHRNDGRNPEDIKVTVILRNAGSSPANHVAIWGAFFFDTAVPEDAKIKDISTGSRNPIAPGGALKIEFSTSERAFPIEAVQALRTKTTRLWACGIVEYVDVFDVAREIGFRFEVEGGVTQYPRLIPSQDGNYAT